MQNIIRQSSASLALLAQALALAGAVAQVPPRTPAGPAASGPAPGSKPVIHITLIGDAGYADASNDAPIRAVRDAARGIVAPELTVFLGDNVYGSGLPPEGDPDRPRGESVLDRQLSVFADDSTMTGVFIPGNHDWDGMGKGGRASITRQGDYIRAAAGPRVRLVPDSARPGPDLVLRNDVLQVIALDSQWWLHDHDRPCYPGRRAAGDAPCVRGTAADSATREAIADSLYGLLHEFGGPVSILLAHHPLETHGPHGGHFDWKDHLFPLRNVAPWLWLPLPVIGSAYPFARSRGYSDQDLSNGEYLEYAARIAKAVNATAARGRSTVFIASGHEHALQVIQPKNDVYFLVSGNGILDHASPLSDGPSTVFGSEMPGYMTLDVYDDGGTLLRVIGVPGRDDEPETLFERWIPAKTR